MSALNNEVLTFIMGKMKVRTLIMGKMMVRSGPSFYSYPATFQSHCSILPNAKLAI